LDICCNEWRGLSLYCRNGFDPEGLELNERAAQNARMAGFTVHTQTLEEFQPEEPFDIVASQMCLSTLQIQKKCWKTLVVY